MPYVILGAFVLYGLAMALSGVVQLRTGRVLPLEQGTFVRPVPYCLGKLLTGTGLVSLASSMAWVVTGRALLLIPSAVGAGCLLLGIAFLTAARYPDR